MSSDPELLPLFQKFISPEPRATEPAKLDSVDHDERTTGPAETKRIKRKRQPSKPSGGIGI